MSSSERDRKTESPEERKRKASEGRRLAKLVDILWFHPPNQWSVGSGYIEGSEEWPYDTKYLISGFETILELKGRNFNVTLEELRPIISHGTAISFDTNRKFRLKVAESKEGQESLYTKIPLPQDDHRVSLMFGMLSRSTEKPNDLGKSDWLRIEFERALRASPHPKDFPTQG